MQRTNLRNAVTATVLYLVLATSPFARGDILQQAQPESPVEHRTPVFSYSDGERYTVDLAGTALAPNMSGNAHIDHKDGRSQVKVTLRRVVHPQSIGASYSTYLLWAVTAEGKPNSIGELPVRATVTFTGTTPLQSFGLMITAEPYATVSVPSGAIVAENVLSNANRTSGPTPVTNVASVAAPPANEAAAGERDFETPLPLLGARHAVEAARRANAEMHAPDAWQETQNNLAALEQMWTTMKPDQVRFVRQFGSSARELMWTAERARQMSAAADIEARRRADEATGRALDAARQVALDAAVNARDGLERARQEAEVARARAEQAQTEAEREKTRADLARAEAALTLADASKMAAEAQRARAEAEEARRQRDALQAKLMEALSEVTETQRHDRGLICSFSDVLFDFDTATLTAGGREKLQKLATVLLAHQASYRVEIEGHTDASGPDDYNLQLSQQRAEAVRQSLEQAGVDASRIVAARGVGSASPVASNDTREGRQLNRRVEVIIAEAATNAGGAGQP
jgi:outer membrane protein OmpA-like peptidoglycan-associated protein